jgi:hypothetical protein
MKTAVIKWLFLFLFCAVVPVAFCQSNWKLTKDKDGIRVYQKEIQNSNFKSIKVESILPGNFDKLISIINNVGNYKDWVYNNKTAYLLKRISPYEFYYYTEAYLPWPLDNRDAAMHTVITVDSLNRFIKISSTAVPNYTPPKSGKVRIKKSSINWFVTKGTANTIRVVYTFETDPGGNVPSWLANSFADKGPYESFKKLGEHLKK